jgi:hypothetical protein
MTTSDFPLLFSDLIDRQMLAGYRETPATWQAYVKRAVVRDFRQTKRYTMSGAESALEAVGESGEYPAAELADGEYGYSVKKYGRKLPISWETLINDDLGAFRDLPQRLSRASRRTEQKFATGLWIDENGPHASLYTVGYGNIVTGNPPLSVAALETAIGILLTQTDDEGEPIIIEAMRLVVPQTLQITARNILDALTLELSTSGGTALQKLVTPNWMREQLSIVVDYYVPFVASNANGRTTWGLFADPSDGQPALEMGFLQGHEEPEIFIKSPNAQRVGGGTANPLDGDFDTDSVIYKLRHVMGGARMNPKMTVASNGSGS